MCLAGRPDRKENGTSPPHRGRGASDSGRLHVDNSTTSCSPSGSLVLVPPRALSFTRTPGCDGGLGQGKAGALDCHVDGHSPGTVSGAPFPPSRCGWVPSPDTGHCTARGKATADVPRRMGGGRSSFFACVPARARWLVPRDPCLQEKGFADLPDHVGPTACRGGRGRGGSLACCPVSRRLCSISQPVPLVREKRR